MLDNRHKTSRWCLKACVLCVWLNNKYSESLLKTIDIYTENQQLDGALLQLTGSSLQSFNIFRVENGKK